MIAWCRNLFGRRGAGTESASAKLTIIEGGIEDLALTAARAMFADFHSSATAALFAQLESAQTKPTRFNTALRRVK